MDVEYVSPGAWGVSKKIVRQVHIVDDKNPTYTLCGKYWRYWNDCSPEPENPKPNECYASCKICCRVFKKRSEEQR